MRVAAFLFSAETQNWRHQIITSSSSSLLPWASLIASRNSRTCLSNLDCEDCSRDEAYTPRLERDSRALRVDAQRNEAFSVSTDSFSADAPEGLTPLETCGNEQVGTKQNRPTVSIRVILAQVPEAKIFEHRPACREIAQHKFALV